MRRIELDSAPEESVLTLDLRVLGPLTVLRGGRTLRLGPPKQRALLAVLVARLGQFVSVDVLTEALWPGRDPVASPGSLQVYVSRLRGLLGRDAIATGAGGYVLNADPDACDAVRFERLLAAGRRQLRSGDARAAAETLRAALDLWTGRPYENIDIPALGADASYLERLRLDALEEWVDAELALGHHSALVTELERLTGEHPLREGLWARRMLAAYRAGRQADALAAYRELREILSEQLGVEPSPELRELETAILRQDPSIADPARTAARPSRSAAPLTSFVGREQDLGELRSLIDRHRLVTLTGLGGSGKTRLAGELAATYLGPGGVHAVVELAGATDGRTVAGSIAASLDAREGAGQTTIDAIVQRLSPAPGLLVLDNCEQIRAAVCSAVSALLAACPKLSILTTSREPLGVPGEAVWIVGPLEMDAATELFHQRASAANPSASAPQEAVRAICERTGCLPLAVELAAARTSVLSADQIAQRLDDVFGLFDGDGSGRLQRALEWSVAELSEPHRTLFGRVAVFAGPFDIDDAEEVCAFGDLTARDVLPGLSRLVATALLLRTDGPVVRYRMLEPARQLAFDLMEDSAEIRDRHLDHYIWLVTQAVPAHGAPLTPATVAELELVQDNVRAALGWAIDGKKTEAALALASRLAGFWRYKSQLAEGRRWLEAALAGAGEADTSEAGARAALGLGTLNHLQGDVEAARRWAEEAMRRAAGRGAEAIEATALLNLGLLAGRSDKDEGQRLLQSALSQARRIGDEAIAMRALDNLGIVAAMRGETSAARALWAEAGAAATKIGDEQTATLLAIRVADLDSKEGDLVGARLRVERALARSHAAGLPFGEMACLNTLAIIAYRSSDLQPALNFATEALDLSRRLGDRQFEVWGLATLAAITLEQGEHERAESLAWELRELAEAQEVMPLLAEAARLLGLCRLRTGDIEAAKRFITEALDLDIAIRRKEHLAASLDAAAQISGASGDVCTAAMALAASDRIYAEMRQQRDEVDEARLAPVRASGGR